jgi:hypothetical protein
MIKRSWLMPAFLVAAVLGGSVGAYFRSTASSAGEMREAAQSFLATLDEAQKAKAVLPYGSPQRVDWHFIPKDERKGLQVKDMTQEQRQAAKALLQACLSEIGFQKATRIMEFEKVLLELEKGRDGGPLRDPYRYYITIFGAPDGEGRWGLSIEGHHLSLNFVVEGDQVISSTPAVFAANPATMMTAVGGVEKGTRILEMEEKLAFDLLASLSAEQRGKAVIHATAPREIRAAGEAQPPQDPAEGIAYGELNEDQARLMRQLVESYTRNMPIEVARQRIAAIRDAGPENVRFAWAGPDQPGTGHYYKVQGPSFLIEFVNTQPDAAGNPANHIHCIWRDMHGDFALPAVQ